MPVDRGSNTSNGTNRTLSGWFGKCITSLSKSDRDEPEESTHRLRPIRPMRSADYIKSKRKRSPMPTTRSRSVMQEKKPSREEQLESAKEHFQTALTVSSAHHDYERQRRGLTDQEDQASWDRSARLEASPLERRANEIVLKIREHERDNLFGNKASEAIPGPETLDMGGQFLTNKFRIEQQSKLFQIAMRMPKGALLHLHFNAELHPERLLQEARMMSTMFVRSTQPLLTQADLDETEIVFNVLAEDTPLANIFSEDYEPEWKAPGSRPWMKWGTFQEEFKRRHGKKYEVVDPPEVRDFILNADSSSQLPVHLNPAEKWIKLKMVLSEEEAYNPRQTVNGVWARFNQATRCFKGLLNYEKVYKWYVGEAIERMIDERIMYAELRPMLMDKTIPTNDGRGTLTHDDQMNLILEGVREKQRELEKKNELHKFPFGLKIIYCTPRSIPKAKMISEMQDCINLKIKYPDLICGFDLVGAEDRPNHIGFYQNELVSFAETCRRLRLEIPFMFHAGETLLDTGGSKEPKNSNLFDAALLKSKRVGHGFSLMKHPHLVQEFIDNDICIELCPISNELLHLCRNVKEHPFPQLLAAGIPCTVNSDNPSLFSNSMSHEFYQIMVGAPTMSLHGWRQLAEWSLKYSCLKADEKQRGLEIFKSDWEEFCQEIVDKYGAYAQDLRV